MSLDFTTPFCFIVLRVAAEQLPQRVVVPLNNSVDLGVPNDKLPLLLSVVPSSQIRHDLEVK